MEKTGEQSWGGRGEEGWRKKRGWRRRGGTRKMLGMGDTSPCFHVPPLQEDSPSWAFREALERSCDWSSLCWVTPAQWWLCLGLLQKKRRRHMWGNRDREAWKGFWHLCSLKTALTDFSSCSEMEVRCFETSFYLAQFYSNLPWGQKHSFSICQEVVLLTLKCQTVIGGWIQNWLLQRSDNSQFRVTF